MVPPSAERTLLGAKTYYFLYIGLGLVFVMYGLTIRSIFFFLRHTSREPVYVWIAFLVWSVFICSVLAVFAIEEPDPEAESDFERHLNLASLEVITARCELSLREVRSETSYQFERLGYFALDKDSRSERLLLNRTVTLKDSWAKEVRRAP